jgi:hypothetical protein
MKKPTTHLKQIYVRIQFRLDLVPVLAIDESLKCPLIRQIHNLAKECFLLTLVWHELQSLVFLTIGVSKYRGQIQS